MQTVITVFDNRQAAQRAYDRLVNAGFDPDDVHLEPGVAPANPAVASKTRNGSVDDLGPERGVLSSLGHFFASLFDQDPPTGGYADLFAEAVQRGHPAIVVDASDDEETDRASTILHELGGLDIDERIATWRGEPSGNASSPAGAEPSHAGVRVFQRASNWSMRDLISEREQGSLR